MRLQFGEPCSKGLSCACRKKKARIQQKKAWNRNSKYEREGAIKENSGMDDLMCYQKGYLCSDQYNTEESDAFTKRENLVRKCYYFRAEERKTYITDLLLCKILQRLVNRVE